jgi:RND superfamily putative drug exporter
VAIPLTSIALSLLVATSIIALLAREPSSNDGPGLGVFTTTRIFVVVLLFGAGTDFCLFFLARNRELLQDRIIATRKQMYRVVVTSWRGVHDALVASALTTIVGLALMWFSRFQKFQFSGPIIAIALAVTLVVCLTFTPALLSALGVAAFWPLLNARKDGNPGLRRQSSSGQYWQALSALVVAKPLTAMTMTIAAMAIPAIFGVFCLERVTYDLTEELSESSPSRRGARLISQFFPTQDGSPLTILLTRDEPFATEEDLRAACNELSAELYTVGVDSVRSLTDPLGDYPPGKRMGLFDKDAWRRRMLASHRITRERYISSVESLAWRVARFDIILQDNPFSLNAGVTLLRIRELLNAELENPNSPWFHASATTSGTTVGISDLRLVTQEDQRRIQVLVTLGVWLVLVVMLRQWILSTYLIFTVLLSYFTTLGVTYWTFSTLYGADYSGLDWKVPLFLFVILVAVGQDYNVYLVTRIFEERRRPGATLSEGVRRALQVTGGIITSCGFVMAGTFIAMTSPAVLHWLDAYLPIGWLESNAPVLRGITELGFALAFGVLLDTLVVRSILVPAFVVHWYGKRNSFR